MHPNAALLQRFYDAFARRDAEAMATCYHRDVVFRDPVFGELRGDDARDMWRMLCARGKDLVVQASGIEADDAQGRAHWVATYTFGRSKRPVRNVIDARFAFRDGLIVRHEDRFSLWRWTSQALGMPGTLLGWTPLVRSRVRREARRGLSAYKGK